MISRIAVHRYAPFALAAALVVVGSFVAYAGGIPTFVAASGADKVLHAVMSFTLTFLLVRARGGQARWVGAAVFVVLALDEYAQRFSPNRSSDWNDLIADLIGILFAVALSRTGASAEDHVKRTRLGSVVRRAATRSSTSRSARSRGLPVAALAAVVRRARSSVKPDRVGADDEVANAMRVE